MTSGHVFHPGHDELHGITVVVHTSTPRTFAGRWDAEEAGLITLLNVALHEADRDSKPKAAWIADTKKYGVAVQFPKLTVPRSQVTSVVRLGDA